MTTALPFSDSTRLRSALLASMLVALQGCANFDGIAPTAQMLDAQQLKLRAGAAGAAAVAPQWWSAFGDTQLDALVAQALAQSPSLAAAQARIARAQAVGDVVRGRDLPEVGAGLDLNRQLFSANGLYPPPIAGNVFEMGTLQASASWEPDFFGKNRAALDAALGQVRAAQADAQAARTLLASSVARTYFQVLRLQAQIDLAQRSVAQREQLRRLVHERVTAGLDTQMELRQSEGELPQARQQLEALREQMQLALNALAALVSKPNEPLVLVPVAQAAIKSVASGGDVPMDLLARRADVAAALQRVQASLQDRDQARAQFYPNINLVAFAGLSSIGFDRLLESGSQQWGVGPAVRLPLFEGGRLRANLRAKTADIDLAIASYNSVVIDAVRDVTDQLSSGRAIALQQAQQAQAQAKAEAAYAIAEQRFAAGMGTRLQVLGAETAVLAQRRQGVDLAARALDTQVQLMRALGGGFHEDRSAVAQP